MAVSKETASFHPCISGLMTALRHRLCEDFHPFQVSLSTLPETQGQNNLDQALHPAR